MTPERHIAAPNLSVAWIQALAAVHSMPKHAATHLVVRIADPRIEIMEIRELADELLALGPVQRISTVRNTIFPAAWATRYPEAEKLADHFRTHYPTLRRFPKAKNGDGTYFGRIVEYPMKAGAFDQLNDLVMKLKAEAPRRHLSSRYEINIWVPGDLPSGMGFPCMSHMSFHLDDGRLFLQAIYRNQYLVERGYGNYLGLAQLQCYVAAATGLEAAELMVVAGHAKVDAPGGIKIGKIKEIIERAASYLPDQEQAED